MKKILVTGALGQIGSELVQAMRDSYGADHVITSDIRNDDSWVVHTGPFETLDVTDFHEMYAVARSYQVDTIIHLAALLSAKAEDSPMQAWHLNMQGLMNALEIAREQHIQLFTPSSVGAFGETTPKTQTSQDTIQRPKTMYGITKVSGELLCDYYHHKYGVDTRGLRFPGLISNMTLPGGGTTDYAVEIFYNAVKEGSYTSFIEAGTYMDMMYMPDAINAIIKLMETDSARLKHRNAFNISAMSVEPEEIACQIRTIFPTFEMHYHVDPVRQAIAESWPNSLNVEAAKEEWGFQPAYDLEKMTQDMMEKLYDKLIISN